MRSIATNAYKSSCGRTTHGLLVKRTCAGVIAIATPFSELRQVVRSGDIRDEVAKLPTNGSERNHNRFIPV